MTTFNDEDFRVDASDLPTPITPQHLLLDEEEEDNSQSNSRGADIVRNIASYLTLSDAQSITSGFGLQTPATDGSWADAAAEGAGGTPYQWSTLRTPPTPALVSISPNPPDDLDDDLDMGRMYPYGQSNKIHKNDRQNSSSLMLEDASESLMMDEVSVDLHRRATWAQERLASAIFSHPEPVRSYCVDAYLAAKEVKMNQSNSLPDDQASPETLVEPSYDDYRKDPRTHHDRRRRDDDRVLFVSAVIDHLLNNVPLSVALDVLGGFREVSLDTSFAAVRITSMTIHGIVDALAGVVSNVLHGITHFNPLAFVQAVISRPFNAMGKTTEVVVSGIQSVATGVGSASSMAFHRLSAKTGSSSNLAQQGGSLFRSRLGSPKVNKKLIRKLSSMNAAASVIAYTEFAETTGGLSGRAKSRVRRMMHYDVSLRPFVATVKLPAANKEQEHGGTGMDAGSGSNSNNRMTKHNSSVSIAEGGSETDEAEDTSASSSPGSPFMCTPQSFPPTPSSRRMVMARGTRFADDVIFLARDQLRVHDALDSKNERTREMALALTQGKRLAVFDADDASAGIDLTCGQHVCTKVGNMLYCSTRSMVPILRNCFVYFEMTVLPKPSGNLIPQASMATLSIGLSTKEMPPNTLVGAWKGSVGLCTTGQMLTAGQWCSPVDPIMSSYGDRATVGCLVCLDDGSAFETWDGVMVTASVTFSVNGRIVSPPVSTLPMAAATPVGDGAVGSALTPIGSPISFDLNNLSTSASTTSSATTTPPLQTAAPAPPSFTLPLLVPAEEELYPTVTLHSPGTAVMCRFSLEDIVATTRAAMGAPSGVAVYAIDGSEILSEQQSISPRP